MKLDEKRYRKVWAVFSCNNKRRRQLFLKADYCLQLDKHTLTDTGNRHQVSKTLVLVSLALSEFVMEAVAGDMVVLSVTFGLLHHSNVGDGVATALLVANLVRIVVLPVSAAHFKSVYLHNAVTCP